MKTPAPPPDFSAFLDRHDPATAVKVLVATRGAVMSGEYLSWDRARYKTPPPGLTHEEWWFGLKMARLSSRRELAHLRDKDGNSFSFNLPDQLLKAIDQINRDASGHIAISAEVTNPGTRDRYIVSSLIEEAITSSQLEGAVTTRGVAKDMIRSGRRPRDHSERMILNNYRAMQRIVDFQSEDLTPDRVREIHRLVTADTLIDPSDAGRLQTDQDERIAVHDEFGKLLHQPPHVSELDVRLQRLCDFANGDAEPEDFYLPPVLRAIAVHFMVGYDHYFVDGNGRTARALFYWCMLRHGYWLTEFLTISTVLKKAPSQYGRSFLLTEQDDGDLTHFYLHHAGVIIKSIAALHDYLGRKAQEMRDLKTRISGRLGEFNHRQIALLEHAVKNPHAEYTSKSHATSHNITTQTARQDLSDLEHRGFLMHTNVGRRQVWSSMSDLASRLTT